MSVDAKVEEKKELEVKPVINLDLACGNAKKEGHIGVDIVKTDCTDIVHDLMVFPYPFEDNSVDSINVSHFVEHIPFPCKCVNDGKDPWAGFWNECYRILKDGAKMYVVAPYALSRRCWQDPTHRRAISEATFLYCNKQWREQNGLSHYEITCDFDYGYSYSVNHPWSLKHEEARNFAIVNYNDVISDIMVTLTKRP